jgi:VIT1/CCC1 family predicted Fe2+/Mn2+ transporter
MGAGEWISMTSQRELFERQIGLARERCRDAPEAAAAELARLYEEKGLSTADATRIADALMEDPGSALDTMVREELGLDPDELGSPCSAAAGSLLSFTAGAAIPLAPYVVAAGPAAFVAAIVLSLIALVAVGAGVSLVTGRRPIVSAVRQVVTGMAAAGVTFAVGTFVGSQVAV